MISTALGRLRITGFLEGLSFVLLLFIAMPLKYKFGVPGAVRIAGMTHGILFIAFVVLAAHATICYRWPVKTLLLLWVASVLPFGTFLADYKFLRKAASERGRASGLL
jgi:integral membrane protein